MFFLSCCQHTHTFCQLYLDPRPWCFKYPIPISIVRTESRNNDKENKIFCKKNRCTKWIVTWSWRNPMHCLYRGPLAADKIHSVRQLGLFNGNGTDEIEMQQLQILMVLSNHSTITLIRPVIYLQWNMLETLNKSGIYDGKASCQPSLYFPNTGRNFVSQSFLRGEVTTAWNVN